MRLITIRFSVSDTASLIIVLFMMISGSAGAEIHYVDATSTNATPPYANWATAARILQDAVDMAAPGDEIVVTNGLYATGGRTVGTNLLVNRVAVDKPLSLRSVNGPQFTIIQGYQVPGTTNGNGAIRCVYLANDASLAGFTLTNGATHLLYDGDGDETGGGGVSCEPGARVVDCLLVGNSAGFGGGAVSGILSNCVLIGNSSQGSGGGAWASTLHNCKLSGNSASAGGGVAWGELNNCTVSANSAGYGGGGALGGILNNCTVAYNSAEVSDGGVGSSDLSVRPPELRNCIVYFNSAPSGPNYSFADFAYSCTTPMPAQGVGNVTNAPSFVDAASGNYRLRPDSPCIDAGTNLNAIITKDLDGRPRPVDGNRDGVASFDIGAYEYRALLVSPESPNPTPPYATWATAARVIQDAVDMAVAGDDIVVTNGVYATGGRVVGTNLLVNRVAVDKPLSLRSVNGPRFTIIRGAKDAAGGLGDSAIRCVYLTNGASLSGFTLTNGATRYDGSWSDTSGGGLWCGYDDRGVIVSNCVVTGSSAYNTGGGVQAGTLYNCTLIGNSALGWIGSGGGAAECILKDSVLTGNLANWDGGGALHGTLDNCTLAGNSAHHNGGGASRCKLSNCTVTGNSAEASGGVHSFPDASCTLKNCIVYFNSPENYDEQFFEHGGVINYSCTTPMPAQGVANITNAPSFVDYVGGNLRLQPNSPCINAGNNSYLANSDFTTSYDLDGNSRVVSGTVDLGAYEFQGSGSTISYAWLQQFGLPIDGSADFTDADGDGHNNWQECVV